jgi:hypothetical protein
MRINPLLGVLADREDVEQTGVRTTLAEVSIR